MNRNTLAAIDMGSNAIRLFICDVENGKINERVYQRSAIRLGQHVFENAIIPDHIIEEVLASFLKFKQFIDAHNCQTLRAVATSAMRDAKNGPDLIQRVFQETGILIEIITGNHEAELTAIAIAKKLRLKEGLLADLGGGSLELVRLKANKFEKMRSFQMGSLRMAQSVKNKARAEYTDCFEEMFAPYFQEISTYSQAVRLKMLPVTGGNSTYLATRFAGKTLEPVRIPLSFLEAFYEELLLVSEEKMIAEYAMRPDRVQTILPSLFIFKSIAKLVGVSEIVVPHSGLREGIIYKLIEENIHG